MAGLDSSAIQLSDRIYLQLVPRDEDVAPLVQLQGTLRAAGVTGRFADPSRFHMTIIHVGELGKVFAEVQPWAPSLSEELFFAQCSLLAEKFETLLPIRTELCGEKLSTYGVHSTTIALQVGIDDEIHRIHKQAVGMLRAFFEAIGIEYIDAFIKGSINFRHAVVLSPHISLLKGAGSSILSERNIFTTVRIRCDSTAIVSHIK